MNNNVLNWDGPGLYGWVADEGNFDVGTGLVNRYCKNPPHYRKTELTWHDCQEEARAVVGGGEVDKTD